MSGFSELLGIEVDSKGTVRVAVTTDLLNRKGTVQGGVFATLLDSAMGMAARKNLSSAYSMSTIQLSVTFVEPGWQGDQLVAYANILRQSERHAMATAKVVRESDGAVLAHGTGSFAIFPR